MTAHDHDPLQPHAHDPNPEPPTADPAFTLHLPAATSLRFTPNDLQEFPQTSVPNCYIVSTGHGTSGPFTFGGVQLLDLLQHVTGAPWRHVEVISADGFGSRIFRDELAHPSPAGPVILAIRIDERALSRQEGLVRLVVPSERDDALRQVKWVARINVREDNDNHSAS